MRKNICLFFVLFVVSAPPAFTQGYGISLAKDSEFETRLRQKFNTLIAATSESELEKAQYRLLLLDDPDETMGSNCGRIEGKLRCHVFIRLQFGKDLSDPQLMAFLGHEIGHWVNEVLRTPAANLKWVDRELGAIRYAVQLLQRVGLDPPAARRAVRESMEKSYALHPCSTDKCEKDKQTIFSDVSLAEAPTR